VGVGVGMELAPAPDPTPDTDGMVGGAHDWPHCAQAVRDTLTRWMGRRLFLGIGFFDDPVSLVIRMILACHLTRIAHSRRNAQLW
jgi:hypothetical protein